MKSPINEIRIAFYNASGSKDIKLQQDIFYFYVDQSESYPEDALDFLLEILVTEELFTKRGINKFFYENLTYTYKLSNIQKEKLTNTIRYHFDKYSNSSFCGSLCETILDISCLESSISRFKELYKTTTQDGKLGIELTCDSLIYQSNDNNRAIIIEKIRTFIPNHQHLNG